MMTTMILDDEDVRRRTKAMMRQRFKLHRQTIPVAAAAVRSKALRERLLALEVIREAKTIAFFYPMTEHREVDLRPLDAALRARGARIAYPRCELAERHMAFHFVDDLDAMETAPMGYREPPEAAPLVDALDVVIVPGLAFDGRGYRIGYGAGFYDRALPRYCPPAASIGVAFDFQLAAEIPNTVDDVAVARIVTDRQLLEIERPDI